MENEKRLIYLDKLVANFRATKIDKVFPNWKELSPNTQAAIIRLTAKYRAIVLNAPIVDAVEVVHGRWEEHPRMTGYLRCSKCHDANIWEDWLSDGKWNYCPNCGAKMDGGNVDDKL